MEKLETEKKLKLTKFYENMNILKRISMEKKKITIKKCNR